MIQFVFVNNAIEDELTTKELKRLLKGYLSPKYLVRLEGRNAYVSGKDVSGEYTEVMGDWSRV